MDNKIEYKKAQLQEAQFSSQRLADFIFENLINKKDIKNLLKDVNTNTLEENKVVRDALYSKLKKDYENFTKYNVQQLHFHLKNNDSFLRFHRPNKFGDNLTEARHTVSYVNKYKKKIQGFEEGKIYSGYRYVYPFFDNNNKHIGSVEVSSSIISFKKLLEKNKMLSVNYVLDKKVVIKKVFASEKVNYKTCKLNTNYSIRDIQEDYDKDYGNLNIHKQQFLNSLYNRSYIKEKMKKKELFYAINFLENNFYLTTFIPLVNAVDKQIVGYIIFIEYSKELIELLFTFIGQFIIMLIFSIVFGIFLSNQIRLRYKNKILSEKYKVILDLSENMILIYENHRLKNANYTFLKFHNISNISDLKYNKIEKYFLDEKNYSPPNSLSHLKEVLINQDSQVVFMMNYITHKKEAFDISIHYIDDNKDTFVLEFKNITDLHMENEELEIKANLDKLTNIYNRHGFEKIFLEKLKLIKHYKNIYSLIMFDIDHFKDINDEHGHNIGDEVLKFLAQLVKSNIREKDILCRWGGEEFMILVEVDLKSAVKTAEILRQKIYNETSKKETIPQISCSFGVTSLADIRSILEATKKVDELLYEAKRDGRNKVVSN